MRALLAGPFLLAMTLLFSIEAANGEELFPLELPDRSSPRATLNNCMAVNAAGIRAYENNAPPREILAHFRRADSCLDMPGVSPLLAPYVTVEVGLLLYEILIRSGIPDELEIPGPEQVAQEDITAWRIPRTGIIIKKSVSGNEPDVFLFDAGGVDSALDAYEAVKHLPNVTKFPDGTYETYMQRPDLRYPYLWADNLPAWASVRILRNPAWKWMAFMFAGTVAVGAAFLVRRAGRFLDKKTIIGGSNWGPGSMILAYSVAVLFLLLDWFVGDVLGLRFGVANWISKFLIVVAIAAAVYGLFSLVRYIAETTISVRQLREQSVNAHLIRVSATIVAVVAAIIIVLQTADYLGLALTPILTGLGIGGLAVALAARPTLENIIGGFTLFADKPARIGDYCRFGELEGTVEEIGLRSTRIRMRDDKLVAIPNADFSQLAIQNNAKIRQRLYQTTIGVRYETSSDQLRLLLAELRKMLLSHPKVSRRDLHVRFLGFGAYSLDISVFAYLDTRDWQRSLAIREDINLRVMDIVNEAGTAFAFPSQTAYLARDGALERDRVVEAEQRVAAWRAEGKLPFPEYSDEEQAGFADRLDYPPEGSVDHVKKGE